MWLCEGDPVAPADYDSYLHGVKDKHAFLKYGRDSLPSYFDIDLMINFIKDFLNDNQKLLEKVAKRQSWHDFTGTCDFCGAKVPNSELMMLDDGRMRCPECSKDAVDSTARFNEICAKVKQAFLTHLGIDFRNISHEACLVSAVELHKAAGREFSITNGYDIRALVGLAMNAQKNVFFVENGYKPDRTFGIIAHELTHIWQYNDDGFKKVRKTNEDLVEGLAVWTDLFLSEKNGAAGIDDQRTAWLARTDQYGRGLRFIMNNCPDDPYGYIRNEASKVQNDA